MRSLNGLIEVFRTLLNVSWPQLQIFEKNIEGEYLVNDWKQFNWELIVERNIFQGEKCFLEPYGEGADFYGYSSRILLPEALPTHAIYCHCENNVTDLLTGNTVIFPSEGYLLECFVAIRDGWYYEEPPFDCILLVKEKIQFVVRGNEVNFKLMRITDVS